MLCGGSASGGRQRAASQASRQRHGSAPTPSPCLTLKTAGLRPQQEALGLRYSCSVGEDLGVRLCRAGHPLLLTHVDPHSPTATAPYRSSVSTLAWLSDPRGVDTYCLSLIRI